jgi:hypothetical protein
MVQTTAARDPMHATLVSVAALGLAAVVLAGAVAGVAAALGVLAGALLATANLWAFAKLGKAMLESGGGGAPWGVLALAKLLVLFGAVIFLLKREIVEAIPLAIGYLVLPVGILAAQLTRRAPDRTEGPA